jgi:ABC-type Fe3+-hydroxamate transport system substrate-binding protein
MRTSIKTTLFALLTGLSLAACGGNGDKATLSRAERSKPATSVTTMEVAMRQPPGAAVSIGPDGTLKIDDVALPQPPAKQQALQNYFGQLQMRRQQVLDQLQSGGGKPITIAPDAQLKPLQEGLMADFPELRPYRASLDTIRLEAR